MVKDKGQPGDPAASITPEAASAVADDVIESAVIPKKIPDVDDIDNQTKALAGALASALLTATEVPLHTLQPVIGALASQMVALGIRQTEHIDPTAIHAPAWITDGIRQESIVVPEQPNHTDERKPFTARTASAPKIPKAITEEARAERIKAGKR